MEEIAHALQTFDVDPEIGAMVITGNKRAFAAGADINEMTDASTVDMLLTNPIGGWDLVQQIKKPVIAAVSGWCLGGGNELAMSRYPAINPGGG
jgi:enoyl-CoA hydratase